MLSIPATNSTNKANKSQGRLSVLKDTVGNAYAAGKEFNVFMIHVMDGVNERGEVVTQDILQMVGSIRTAMPYTMANATGDGEEHAVF